MSKRQPLTAEEVAAAEEFRRGQNLALRAATDASARKVQAERLEQGVSDRIAAGEDAVGELIAAQRLRVEATAAFNAACQALEERAWGHAPR